jgi:predicted house-cleaning noncanonical NTP pyrophosphatase (MazG superfamily)
MRRARLLHLVLPFALLSAFGLHACGKMMDASAPATAAPGPAAADPAPEKGKTSGGEPSVSPRKIIRNGEIQVVVKRYAPARQAIEEMVRQAGGYIASSQADHSLGEVSSATLVLRVPAGQFESVSARIARLGTVVRESTGSRDITEEYYDLKARLTNAKKLETRLQELLASKQTSKIQDLLEVERELARVRGEIERFEGKLRLFDNLVDLSTITVRLSIQERYVPPRPPSFGEDVRSTLRDSWQALRSFGRGFLLVMIALLPWAVPGAILVWLLVRTLRRRRAKRAASKAASKAALPTAPPPATPADPDAKVPPTS